MPSFNSVEIRVIEQLYYKEGKPIWIYPSTKNELINKCIIDCDPQTNGCTITEYGKKVFKFHQAIKAGLVKTKKSECHGCGGC
jgi:hypothetical protein